MPIQREIPNKKWVSKEIQFYIGGDWIQLARCHTIAFGCHKGAPNLLCHVGECAEMRT